MYRLGLYFLSIIVFTILYGALAILLLYLLNIDSVENEMLASLIGGGSGLLAGVLAILTSFFSVGILCES